MRLELPSRFQLRWTWFLASCVLVGAAPPFHAEAAEWSALTEAKVLYTDNVSELSATRRLALSEDPSQPTIVPLKNPQDVVWEPSLDVRRVSETAFGPTEFSMKATGFIFTDHSIFNHGNYRLQVKQTLTPDTSLLLRYRYIPNLFLGPNIERRSGTRLLEEERVTSHVWRAQLEHVFNQQWTATLVGRYGLRLFNEAFAERDTKFWTLGPQVTLSATSWLTLTLAYLYERGLADGQGDVQVRDDVSYRQHFLSVGSTFVFGQGFSLDLGYAYRRKDFASDLAGDSNRGVVDTTHVGSAELRYRMSPAASVTVGLQRAQRASNAASRDFFNTNTSVGLQYRF